MTDPISRDELARRIAERTVLVVEALGSDFFHVGHLPEAVSLPLESPDAVLATLVRHHPERQIVVYGSGTGQEASELARRIESIGSRSVLVYEGGKEDWVEAGLGIERS